MIRGFNHDELVDLLEFAGERAAELREKLAALAGKTPAGVEDWRVLRRRRLEISRIVAQYSRSWEASENDFSLEGYPLQF